MGVGQVRTRELGKQNRARSIGSNLRGVFFCEMVLARRRRLHLLLSVFCCVGSSQYSGRVHPLESVNVMQDRHGERYLIDPSLCFQGVHVQGRGGTDKSA
jgi:hypothetical protein